MAQWEFCLTTLTLTKTVSSTEKDDKSLMADVDLLRKAATRKTYSIQQKLL